jgi:formylmethanofuran dehydrogenase subunit E
MNVPDNYDLWKQHDAEQQLKLDKLPLCSICEERIQDDYYYEINDECICECCLAEYYRKDIDEY